MYVAIDKSAMRFTHANDDHRVVRDLVHIEMSHSPMLICATDSAAGWDRLTDLELKLLYRNACGVELPGYMKDDHMRRCMAAGAALVPNDVNAFELRVAALRIPFTDGRRFKYVKGSSEAVLQSDLFEPDTLRVPDPLALTPVAPPAPAPGPARTHVSTTPAAAPASGPSAPRAKGSVAEAVFAAADKMWDERGQPRGAREVLALRKDVMDKLESEQGIKRTTSSTTLGAWQKLRLNG